MAEQEPVVDSNTQEDDELGHKEQVLLKYFLQEWKFVKSLLDSIVSNGGITDYSTAGKIRSIVSIP